MSCYICNSQSVFACNKCGRHACENHFHRHEHISGESVAYEYLCTECYRPIKENILKVENDNIIAQEKYCLVCKKPITSSTTKFVRNPITVGVYKRSNAMTTYDYYWVDIGLLCSKRCFELSGYKTKEQTDMEARGKSKQDDGSSMRIIKNVIKLIVILYFCYIILTLLLGIN